MQTFPNKTPNTEQNKTSAIGSLNTLFIRNESAAKKYQQAAESTDDESLKEFFVSLSNFRSELAGYLRKVIEDMPPSPMPPTKTTKAYLSENWDDFLQAINKGNRSKITDHCKKSEDALLMEYKKALELKGVPMSVHEMLEKQSEHLMKVKRKVERMETVPMLKNNGFSD